MLSFIKRLFDVLICPRCGGTDFETIYWFDDETISHRECNNCSAVRRYTTMDQGSGETFEDERWEL